MKSVIYVSFVASVLCIGSSDGQEIFGIDVSYLNPFGLSKPINQEFQSRRYRCDPDLGLNVAKSCLCIMRVVRKKSGFLAQLGCDARNPAVDDMMMEVNAVYNFTTVSILSNDLFGNTCPIGTEEDFFKFVNAVQNYRLSFAQPCPFPLLNRFQTVDSDFDSKLVDTLKPILPVGGAYNGYVRVYRSSSNLTLAFQTLYGSTPLLDLGLGYLPGIGNALG